MPDNNPHLNETEIEQLKNQMLIREIQLLTHEVSKVISYLKSNETMPEKTTAAFNAIKERLIKISKDFA